MKKYYIDKISIEKIKSISCKCSMNFQTLILTEMDILKLLKMNM